MKKRIVSFMLAASMVMSLAACGSTAKTEETTQAAAQTEAQTEAAKETEAKAEETQAEETEEQLELEKTHIKWAKDSSGNVFLAIALKNGWFEEVGITIEEVPFDSNNDALTALTSGQIDIISNYGTNNPLTFIGRGEDINIIGGYMATGCLPIVAREETEWTGVESLVGKRIASSAGIYALYKGLMDAGYDPLTDVEWVEYPSASDRLAAVVKGECDFAHISTSRNYEVSQTEGVKICAYTNDFMPYYSCCRMCAMGDFVEENPNTVKTIIKILLRAQSWYEANKDESIDLMVDYMGVTREYLESFMPNENFRASVDPLKNSVVEGWNILLETGYLPEGSENINIEDYIKTDVYKEALDMAIAEYYEEAPEFYDHMVEFYKEYNE